MPSPSRLWAYLVRLISEGQWLTCPLDKHSQANKNKEHKYTIEKDTALLKIATPISVLPRKRVLLVSRESRALCRSAMLYWKPGYVPWALRLAWDTWKCFRIVFITVKFSVYIRFEQWMHSWTSCRYSKCEFLHLYAHKACIGTVSCHVLTFSPKINFWKETLR